MYKCDFFYSKSDYTDNSQPHVLSCWNVLTDINYSYTRKDTDREFYPAKTLALIHCLDGEGELVTTSGTIALRTGDFAVYQLSSIVSYKAKSRIWEYFWVDFICDTPLNVIKICSYIIGNFERELYAELHQAGSAEHQLTSYINVIFHHYLSRLLHYKAAIDSPLSAKVSIREIYSFIDQKYMLPLTVEDVAGFFNISPRRLDQIFSAAGDITPKRYILLTKINKSKSLLTDTSVNISEIANMLSFSNPFHFSKTFKLLTGTTPTLYRNKK